MAAFGVLAVVVIVMNLAAKAPTTLKMLRIDDVSYISQLHKGEEIKIQLPTGKESVFVDARPTDGNAVVKVTGDSNFKDGDNTLTINVTGSDGKSSSKYTVTLVKPKLEGWCAANTEEIAAIETAWADELMLRDIDPAYLGYAELGSKSALIRAHMSCFSQSLQDEITKNY
jgi:hypothetical protein